MMYIVLSSTSLSNLVSQVTSSMAEGWKPLGGVAVNNAGFFQAMVK